MITRVNYEACPFCGREEFSTFLTADCSGHPLYKAELEPLITWCQCSSCEHVFTSGYLSDEAVRLVFSNTHAHQQVGFDLEQQRLVASRMIERILPYAKLGAWLDVGFGNGSLLFTAAEYGFTPVGIDLRPVNVAVMRRLGIEAHAQEVSELDAFGQFAVVSMADVLEHMPYPGKALRSVHALLADGGILFLSMPNSDSMLWTSLSLSNENPYWGELEHYHNFGRKRLYTLLAECGYHSIGYGVSERYRCGMEIVARMIEG